MAKERQVQRTKEKNLFYRGEGRDEGERGEWRSWLNTRNIQETKIVAFGPVTSWQIDGETVETMTDFISLSSKITADSDCNHEIKWHLLLGRKAMTNLGSIIKKQRHYFADKGLCSQRYVFSSSHVWMWVKTIKKAEHWRIDAFEPWCWRRLLRVPWTARRSNPKGNQF